MIPGSRKGSSSWWLARNAACGFPQRSPTKAKKENRRACSFSTSTLLDIPNRPTVRRQGAARRREENGERPRIQGPARRHRWASPEGDSTVTVQYTGWTTDGKMFDSSVVRGQPASFSVTGVIKGWTEGLQLMFEGEKARFWIPEKLAYEGKRAPYGMLVFDVELLNRFE